MDIGRELAAMKKQIAELQRAARLSSASLDDTALLVRDGAGSLRGIVGQQGDGTTAVNVVNGPPPPQPSPPIVASVLGGVTASWDGLFTGGQVLPLDWSRTEVHASTTTGFTPDTSTLRSTIETAQGATVVIPTDSPVYVRLVARSTSGTASAPSDQTGPYGPTPVVATDLLDGIVTTLKLADDAVTAAKVAVDAIDSTALADGAVLSAKLADAAVSVGKLAENAVTGPAIASDAVTAGKVAADAITAREIAAGAVTAAEVAAGAITTDKLTVTGGANLLSDPSFEGAYTASLVAGLAYATQDTTKGNGSPTSLKIDATAASATYRSVQLTVVPVLPGEQLALSVDYFVSTDWAGAEVNFQIRWETSTGTILGYGKASTATPTRNTWVPGTSGLTGTYTAPATATVARIRVESGAGTAGTVWFDNASVRPVLPGTQIQNGAITTPKIVSGAVQTLQLDAEAVNASKIAAGAVTTAKLDALAVTADKIAANAITVGKLDAGSVDATALKADAITGKTITGGTVTGATVTGGIVQTGTSGQRVVLNPQAVNPSFPTTTVPAVELHSGAAAQTFPGSMSAQVTDDASAYPYVSLRSPAVAAIGPNGQPINAELRLLSSQPGVQGGSFRIDANPNPYNDASGKAHIYGAAAMNASDTSLLELVCFDGDTAPGGSGLLGPGASIEMSGTQVLIRVRNSTTDRSIYITPTGMSLDGKLTAGNIRTGRVTITPTSANTPASTTVTGLAMTGTDPRAVATASTTVPGTQMLGVGCTNVTLDTVTIWLTRTNTSSTGIDYIVIAS